MELLKETEVERVFWAWVEDWEEETRKENDCVAKEQLLAKYIGLVFRDPDSGKSFLIWEQNKEFLQGKGNYRDWSPCIVVFG